MRIISFGLIGDEPVFVDEFSDSYFCLEGNDRDAFLEDLAASNTCNTDRAQKWLGEPCQDLKIVRTDRSAPVTSLIEESARVDGHAFDAIKIAWILWRTKSLLGSMPIDTALQLITSNDRNRDRHIRSKAEIVARSKRFIAVRNVIPVRGNCLLDSLAMLRWLGARHSNLSLVFGVKLDPFAAHCWVQLNDVLLNDRIETVAAFTPVRVRQCSDATQ